jgi:hypothetical protein
MCCCSSHIPHDESSQYILIGGENAISETIFNKKDLITGKLVIKGLVYNNKLERPPWLVQKKD